MHQTSCQINSMLAKNVLKKEHSMVPFLHLMSSMTNGHAEWLKNGLGVLGLK